jgi:hypothetical protein
MYLLLCRIVKVFISQRMACLPSRPLGVFNRASEICWRYTALAFSLFRLHRVRISVKWIIIITEAAPTS